MFTFKLSLFSFFSERKHSFTLCSIFSSGVYCYWSAADGTITNWRTPADHFENQDIQILSRLPPAMISSSQTPGLNHELCYGTVK
jgi:hypothetical protein